MTHEAGAWQDFWCLFGFLDLEHYLSDLLGIQVDPAMKGALRPRIGRRRIGEVVAV
jgi:predicted nucleotidyltransferase